jgi:hypothetical protein
MHTPEAPAGDPQRVERPANSPRHPAVDEREPETSRGFRETPAGDWGGGEVPADAVPPFITASFMWDQREHARVIRQITRHAKGATTQRMALWFLALLLTGWMLLDGSLSVLWMFVVLWVLLPGFGSSWLSARSYARQHPGVTQPWHFTLSDEGVRSTSASADTVVRWAALRNVVETREFFLFFVADRRAQFLPKRALAEWQLPQARALIQRHVALQDRTRS